MLYRIVLSLPLLAVSLSGLFAQHPVDPGSTQARILAVVPMIGSGKAGDPVRPAYTPLPPSADSKPDIDGILGFSYQLTDDGKHAIVEFVARDRSAFKAIMADKRPDVKVFEKGVAKKAEIEAEFKKYKKDIDLDKRVVSVR